MGTSNSKTTAANASASKGPEVAAKLKLTTAIDTLPGMSRARANRYTKLGLRTVQDLLFLFPRDYERPAPAAKVDELREGEPASMLGAITDTEIVSRTPGKSVFGAVVENESGSIRILFFNQAFRAEQLTLGRRVIISGTPKLSGLRWEFVHPKVTILDETETLPEPRMMAIYPLTEGVKHSELRNLAETYLPLATDLPEVMPESLRSAAAERLREKGIQVFGNLPSIDESLRQLHLPDNEISMLTARTRLVFQELFVMQLALAMKRRRSTTNLHAPPLPSTAMIDARITNRLPFTLTGDQRLAIDEIRADMSRQFPMNRLLQGDVGSGKTVVAVYAMMLTVAGGHQAVLMAPTEVLARQHFKTMTEMLEGSRVRIGLLCGSLSAADRRDVFAKTASGEIDLLIGTQALLYGGIEFHQLGLCVVDEQHKFGVNQRVQLRTGGLDPHSLVMSATPIPRSIAMTMFGDVELSTIREKPPGRGKINTYLSHDGWKDRWWAFVRERLGEGRQAFVVAPRVSAVVSDDDESETEDVSSVETVYEDLCNGPLADYRVGLLHGKMSNDEKQAIMQAFAAGRTQVLVSTTVIEVGINIPNATVMTIMGGQQFGLAQLHQLRGRVARGSHAGHVCVFTDGERSPDENERLKVFEQTDDGFELAEADFRLRGPGDLLGRKQSGMPPMRIADLNRDVEVLVVARAMAQEIIDEDPELESEDFAALREQMMRRYGKRMNLGDAA
ncbi:ATP-dependent DNA helicase RecG [Rubripirellula reticaptiva]|uniref:Probable DNA 3'-5' helicase RecG n=1 Tax=Rubripirellula reticaptiva TaxID=2528013 RepID=A0A5C6FEI7_9BACT|nr:ATP-dependent DNA helicase RecG [Rubripirellula reticaptiva]TWU57991.1 ATP-dependent DNA helicase RecG [Rubripirellula reticaptiva]